MALREILFRQFRQPQGVLGRVAGWIMATRPSNRLRNAWTVGLLEIRPHDRILEFGCGPGLALKAAGELATSGIIVGLDHSEVMLAQAAVLNREQVAQGRVRLTLGNLDRLAELGGPFDKIFSLNVVQFLADRAGAFHALHEVLLPGGTLATTYQPRHRNPTRADALRMAREISAFMQDVGFVDIRTEELSLRPVPAICVLGRRAPSGPGAAAQAGPFRGARSGTES